MRPIIQTANQVQSAQPPFADPPPKISAPVHILMNELEQTAAPSPSASHFASTAQPNTEPISTPATFTSAQDPFSEAVAGIQDDSENPFDNPFADPKVNPQPKSAPEAPETPETPTESSDPTDSFDNPFADPETDGGSANESPPTEGAIPDDSNPFGNEEPADNSNMPTDGGSDDSSNLNLDNSAGQIDSESTDTTETSGANSNQGSADEPGTLAPTTEANQQQTATVAAPVTGDSGWADTLGFSPWYLSALLLIPVLGLAAWKMLSGKSSGSAQVRRRAQTSLAPDTEARGRFKKATRFSDSTIDGGDDDDIQLSELEDTFQETPVSKSETDPVADSSIGNLNATEQGSDSKYVFVAPNESSKKLIVANVKVEESGLFDFDEVANSKDLASLSDVPSFAPVNPPMQTDINTGLKLDESTSSIDFNLDSDDDDDFLGDSNKLVGTANDSDEFDIDLEDDDEIDDDEIFSETKEEEFDRSEGNDMLDSDDQAISAEEQLGNADEPMLDAEADDSSDDRFADMMDEDDSNADTVPEAAPPATLAASETETIPAPENDAFNLANNDQEHELLAKIAELQRSHETVVENRDSLQEQNEQLNAASEAWQNEAQEYSTKLAAGETEQKTLAQTNLELTDSLKSAETELATLAELKTKSDEWQSQAEISKTEIEALQADKEKLQADLEKHQSETETLQSQNEELSNQLTQFEAQQESLEQLTAELQTLKTEKSESATRIAKLEAESATRITELESAATESASRIAELESDAAKYAAAEPSTEDDEAAAKAQAEAETERAALTGQLSEKSAENAELVKKLNAAQRALSANEAELEAATASLENNSLVAAATAEPAASADSLAEVDRAVKAKFTKLYRSYERERKLRKKSEQNLTEAESQRETISKTLSQLKQKKAADKPEPAKASDSAAALKLAALEKQFETMMQSRSELQKEMAAVQKSNDELQANVAKTASSAGESSSFSNSVSLSDLANDPDSVSLEDLASEEADDDSFSLFLEDEK